MALNLNNCPANTSESSGLKQCSSDYLFTALSEMVVLLRYKFCGFWAPSDRGAKPTRSRNRAAGGSTRYVTPWPKRRISQRKIYCTSPSKLAVQKETAAPFSRQFVARETSPRTKTMVSIIFKAVTSS
ncbi:unnamed protein product, partial [Iphiclides podalirius]